MISSKFPLYTEHRPLVTARCVTPDLDGCIHRFFDTNPISPSGKYLAVFQFSQEKRVPQPGEKGRVILIDLETAQTKILAETCGWETQMGANINWGNSDNELYFNDVDTKTWRPFAWKLDPVSGEKEKMEGTVYHASSDGKWLISANLTSMRRTQPGYGVMVPDEKARRNIGAAEDDGFYLTDTATGKCRLLISVADILRKADPQVNISNPDDYEIYGFHSKFNQQGDMLMLSLRWYEKESGKGGFDMFARYSEKRYVKFAWVTVTFDGKIVWCSTGPEEWEKHGHHATWFPDGRRISMNLNIDRDDLRFVQVDYNGKNLKKILDGVVGSGHPTIHCNGRNLLTDCYPYEKMTDGDGTIPLRWIDLETAEEKRLLRINVQPSVKSESCMRIDPHPAWDESWRYITFNASVGGTRKVFIADLKKLL